MVRVARAEKNAPLLVGLVVCMLLALASWGVSLFKIAGDRLYLNTVLTCRELDAKLRPLQIDDRFSSDSRQVCLWIRYSEARAGDHVLISWRYADKLIQKESMRLTEVGGIKVFYLVREDGASLPPGEYAITVHGGQKRMAELKFQILPGKE